MTIEVTPKRLASLLAASLLALGGVTLCFAAYKHLKTVAASELSAQYLSQAGDAPPEVQQGVRVALHDFQDGYTRRDRSNIDSFMTRLFEKNDDILIIGTDHSEWARGYSSAAQFIKTDWSNWGDFRFAVDDSIICSSGDVAWVASVGTVRTEGVDRPVRFSAILTRNGDHWLFRQVHFQWEDRPASAASLLTMKR